MAFKFYIVDSLFVAAPITLCGALLGPSLVVQCLVSVIVLQSSWWKKESCLLYFYCLPGVL